MTDGKESLPGGHPVAGPVATATLKPASSRRSDFGAAALAILFYALLVDAAVETFISGAPVRWWVTTAIAAYLVLTVCVWRFDWYMWTRLEWSARASASFFLLLGLLAATTWMSEGLAHGMTVLRQPTSVVLSAVTAIAVAFAGIAISRVRLLPWWGRAALGALAAYGETAFVFGIVNGTSYLRLFHGESMWARLPFWLQGTSIGALIVVPAGLLLRAVRIFRAASVSSRKWSVRQVVAMGMTNLMAISAVTGTAQVGDMQLSTTEITQPALKSYQALREELAGPRGGVRLSTERAADRLEELFRALEQGEREIPRDTFDLRSVIDRAGRDPNKLFEWVRDHTYLVPYRGMLRGDAGVLMDRLGNSLDRALLLYALLRTTGQNVRLARGRLTDAQAQELFGTLRKVPTLGARTLRTLASSPDEVWVQRFADESHLDAAQIRKDLGQLAADQERVKESVQKRVAIQSSMIAAAIGRQASSRLADDRADQVRALTDHWWVQWQNGKSWLDFDPTLSDSQPGRALTTADTTSAPERLTDLGDELRHEVQIQVVIEVSKHGHLTEVPVLTQKLLPAALYGQRVVLRQIPVHWPTIGGALQTENSPEHFKATVLAQAEWLPVLSVGSQRTARYSFNSVGDLTDTTLPGYVQNAMSGRALVHKMEDAAEDLGRGVGGILRRSASRGPVDKGSEMPKSESAQLTAEWIVYQIHTPGAPVRTVRREVMDLLGPAARAGHLSSPEANEELKLSRALALLSELDILVAPADLSSDFVDHLRAKNLLDSRRAVIGLLRGAKTGDLSALARQAGTIDAFEDRLYDFMIARREFNEASVSPYLDQVNIFALLRQLHRDEHSDTGFLLEQRFDIVANEMAVPRNADSFSIRLHQGVLDTNLEAVLAGQCKTSEGLENCEPESNAAELLVGRSKAGVTVIRDVGDGRLQAVGLPADARERMREEIASGYAVAIPSAVVQNSAGEHVAWWRVNAATGATVGIGGNGAGQVATEERIVQGVSWGAVSGMACLAGAAAKFPMKGTVKQGACYDAQAVLVCAVGSTVGALTGYSTGLLAGSQMFARLLAIAITGFFAGSKLGFPFQLPGC